MKEYIKIIKESLEECGDTVATPTPPAQVVHQPVAINVNMSASGEDNVKSLLDIMKNAGLGDAKPVSQKMMPVRKDMERLRTIVGEPSGSVMSDETMEDEELEESMDPKEVMGQIRKMAKGVETNPDEREHRIFAQQVESELIDLFQYFSQKKDAEKKQILQNLIRQNRKAQQQTDRTNANNIVSVLWDLMNATETMEDEGYDNTPGEVYHDTEMLTHNLAGGLNKAKGAYASAEDGDNAMAVKNIKEHLIAALTEKKKSKKKPDSDGDGVPDWADKHPGKDDNAGKAKGKKPKKGVVPPQFKKKK